MHVGDVTKIGRVGRFGEDGGNCRMTAGELFEGRMDGRMRNWCRDQYAAFQPWYNVTIVEAKRDLKGEERQQR